MKTVLITGVDKGIGKALMEKFLGEGHFVIGTYYFKCPRVDIGGNNIDLIPLDLTSRVSIGGCVRAVALLERPIDILINNAGVLLDEKDTSVVNEKLRETFEVNLFGTTDLTEQVVPLMASGGHIVNISSTAGSLGLPVTHDHHPHHYPAYKISKAALNMYTKTLADRLRGKIVVSSVHPGWVRTDMGGEDADTDPREAAENIYKLALSKLETGQFWSALDILPW